MSPLSGTITFAPHHAVYHHFLKSLGDKAYVVEHQYGKFISSQPIFEHRGIFCTGSSHALQFANLPLKPAGLPKVWESHNTETLGELSGEFAFLIWDTRTQNIWAIRDHFGSIPLHYYCDRTCFAFSHRARPLWAIPSPGIKTINESRILDYIVDDLEHATQTETFRQNIHRVPMAGCVHWNNGSVQTHQYWKPDLSQTEERITDASAVESFQKLLSQSILNKSGEGRAMALLVSGGLDSNAIHAAWRKTKQYKEGANHLISLLPETENRNDSECDMLQNEVSRNCPLPHTYVTPGAALRNLSPIESLVQHVEDPFTMHALSGPAPCYQVAVEKGVTHVMDGIDGDLIGGIPSGYWNYLWAGGDRLNAVSECICSHRVDEESIHRSIKALVRMFLSGHSPNTLRRLSSLKPKKDWVSEQAKSWQSDLKIRDSVFPESFIRQRIQLLGTNHPTPSCNSIAEYMFQGMMSPMLGVGVERYAEAANLFGLKAIHPLLDKNLAEFFLRLPWHYKVKNGREKRLFRLFLDQNDHKKIARETKLPHVGPWFTLAYQRDYLKRHPKPKSECLDAVNKYVDASWLLTEWDRYSEDDSEGSTNEDLWRIMMLGEWLVQNA